MTDLEGNGNLPANFNWTDEDGNHEGGQSIGIGFTIAWQRGSLNEMGRNGAFLIEVLEACQAQLEHYQLDKFACPENQDALSCVESAISHLQARRDRRQRVGMLGTTPVSAE